MMIPVAEPSLTGREKSYVMEALAAGQVSSAGPFVGRFEKAFARFVGTRFGVSASNGTTGLHLALMAAGIQRGDQVLVPAMTFVASASSVVHANARPVFVDVDPETWCMDPSQADAAMGPRTKAIMPVHLWGNPCDMDSINRVARSHNALVVEDAAEAHGAMYRGRRVGGLGDVGLFSFYGNKIMTTGEGGMLTTNRGAWARRALQLRNHGMDPRRRYWHPVVGYNYRMTNLQAALGLAQVERSKVLIQRKRAIATLYREELADAPLRFQVEAKGARSVHWMFSVLLDASQRRSVGTVMKRLASDGIETRPFFFPIPIMPPYKRSRKFPVSAELHRRGLCLPSGATLTDAQVSRTTRALKRALA